ncbi:MAG: hypothetical protein R3233_10740 [Xanthomonadales bacterium]|nr:hypothetical protein [Xanthomonadales bacterium]
MPAGPTSRSPWLTLAIVAVLAVALLALAEWGWRARGFEPTRVNDADLWSVQRRAARGADAWMLLGASRMQLGFHRPTFEARYPACRLANLTVNGHYPLAALRDLADDPAVSGTVLVSSDARSFRAVHRDMQQAQVDHYHGVFSPERHLNRLLANAAQSRLVVANPEHNWVQALRRWLGGEVPVHGRYTVVEPDGLVAADYTGVDTQALVDHWERGLEDYYAQVPPESPREWLEAARVVVPWVEAIEARGGRVVFVRLPTSGPHWRIDEREYPRSAYWDQLETRLGLDTLHFKDVPALDALDLPDSSHVDQRDRGRLTSALLDALEMRFGIAGCSGG